MRDKTWIKSPWTISIGTAIFSLFLTIIYDFLKSKPILSTVWQIISGIFKFIILILNFNLKVWWVIVGLIIITIIIYLIISFKNEETIKPDFYNYTEEVFKRWRWSWRWEFNNYRKAWNVSELTAHCPKCDTPLIDYSNYVSRRFGCPRCDFSASDSECDEPHKIESIILDNVKRKRESKGTHINF